MKRHGKKILALLLVSVLILMTGCSKTPAKSEIIGIWKCEDAQKMLDGFLQIISIPSGLMGVDLTLEFREDNTYEITGSFNLLFYVQDIPTETGTYSYTNGELYLDGTKFDGLKISGNKLTIESKDSDGRTIRIPFTKQN